MPKRKPGRPRKIRITEKSIIEMERDAVETPESRENLLERMRKMREARHKNTEPLPPTKAPPPVAEAPKEVQKKQDARLPGKALLGEIKDIEDPAEAAAEEELEHPEPDEDVVPDAVSTKVPQAPKEEPASDTAEGILTSILYNIDAILVRGEADINNLKNGLRATTASEQRGSLFKTTAFSIEITLQYRNLLRAIRSNTAVALERMKQESATTNSGLNDILAKLDAETSGEKSDGDTDSG